MRLARLWHGVTVLTITLLCHQAHGQPPPATPSTVDSPPPAAVSPPPRSTAPPPPPASTLGKYDPCTSLGLATRSKGFYVGVAFWPGHTVEEWGLRYNTTSLEFGLNPCNITYDSASDTSHRAYLASTGAVFGSFEVKVDMMSALKFSASDITRLYNATQNTTEGALPRVVSAVVFRAGIRSEARYIVSSDTSASNGVGFVTDLAVGASFSAGALTALTWDDVGCNACGGLSSNQCIRTTHTQPQHSCTLPLADCSTYGNCTLAVYMGFSGADRHGTTLNTASQIHQINQYSATTLYYRLTNSVSNILNGASSTTLGSSNTAVDSSGSVA